MARSADLVRRRLWRGRLQRFERGRLTVAAFCQAEGVSVPSFYQWRRRLGPASSRSAAHAAAIPKSQTTAVTRQTFVPVEIVTAATIDIRLPNGVRLAVPTADPAALEAVVAAVGRLPQAASQESEAC